MNRRKDLGYLEQQGSKCVYENDRVKGYGNSAALVPTNIYCLAGIKIDEVALVFGDKFGELVFLFAISLPEDRQGLPTAFLCVDADQFGQLTAVDTPSQPEHKHFCLCSGWLGSPIDFLEDNKFTDQICLLTEQANFKEALKRFIIFILTLKRSDPERADALLGISKPLENTTPESATTVGTTGATYLTESEKEALMNKDGKKSNRLLGKDKTYYGISSKPKVPLGSATITIPPLINKGGSKRKGGDFKIFYIFIFYLPFILYFIF